ERPVEAGYSGIGSAGEIRIDDYIDNPGRLTIGPDAPRKADANFKESLSAHAFEFQDVVLMPGVDAAQPLNLLIDHPELPEFPAQTLANGLDDVGRRFFKRV